MVDQHGEVLTDPVEMASALREHWRGVFARRPVDTQLLNAWLEEDSPPAAPPPDGAAWQLGAHHVQAAIERSPDSAPGPDGIPFKAWRQLGPLGVDVLGAALQALTAPDAPEDLQAFLADFNGSLMVFLPKGDGLLPDGRTGHAPSDTRPLNIVNSDNRLLAAAVRFCVEEPLSTMITVDQQGFVPGRSMLSNVVDIDEIMMLTALSQPRGSAGFFDFQAAFPSVAHDFLMAALRAAGLPGWLTRFVEYLYEHNNCKMVVGGKLHTGFSSHAGIRQGCPLSPILFAVAVDVLLRRLRAKVPGVELRAFADDVAAVVSDLMLSVPSLHTVFHEFGRLSGLRLNLPKTVMVPLFLGDRGAIAQEVIRDRPGWGGLRVADHAKYLGFVLGPGRGCKAYDKALSKYLDRAASWGKAGGGLFATAVAYSSYVASVVSFLIQLDGLPPRWPAVEAEAFRALVPGIS